MKFTKMHGCGNDYVYVNVMNEEINNPSELSVKVSNRHYGIGSDGLILICSSDCADFRMEIYNADGSSAEMCGNGIRCFGKYVYDHGLTKKTKIRVETGAGIKKISLVQKEGVVIGATVDMGIPIIKPEQIPVLCECEPVLQYPVMVKQKDYRISCVSMGNPHAVVYMDDVNELDIGAVGPEFEHHPLFPKRINTEFVQIIDRTHLKMRVWERGSGETSACGTGACATAYISMLNGLCDRETQVEMRGGSLQIRYEETDGHIYMTGPAVTTFEGDFQNMQDDDFAAGEPLQ